MTRSLWPFAPSVARAKRGPRRRVVAAALAAVAGCSGGGPCGAGDAGDGIEVTAGAELLVYGGFTSSPNNDCPAPNEGAPTSLTVDGVQSTAAGFHFTLCLPRPDQLGDQPIALDQEELVEVVNINGQLAGSCVLTLDRTRSFSAGSIRFDGYCGDGLDPAGYSIALSGTLPGTLTCPGPDGSVSVPADIDLAGNAAVTAL